MSNPEVCVLHIVHCGTAKVILILGIERIYGIFIPV